jgi:hypothetical protein
MKERENHDASAETESEMKEVMSVIQSGVSGQSCYSECEVRLSGTLIPSSFARPDSRGRLSPHVYYSPEAFDVGRSVSSDASG